jgi:predicted nucleotidyltransferase
MILLSGGRGGGGYIISCYFPMNEELQVLAEILAQWVDAAPGVPAVYLFGSRVRGDHRPDSDVDIRLFLDDWTLCETTRRWWQDQNETDFAELKSRLPGPLAIHREKGDKADKDIRKGKASPVLVVRKVVCVRTPPKSRCE